MAFGILEPATNIHVPGTVLLDQLAANSASETADLKHGTGSNKNIILAPQPSVDPNDPLNWTSRKKHSVLAIICLGVIIHGCLPGPLLNAGTVQVAINLNVTPTAVAQMGGYLLLATGSTGIFVSALGHKFGKRPWFVLSSVIGTLGTIIAETATGYNQLLAGRVLQGVATAAYESLAIAMVGDIFFVHERGPRIAVVMFLLSSISNGCSIVAGVITSNLGWQYNFHILLPFAIIQLILLVLFAPETSYNRKTIYEIDTVGSSDDLGKLARHEEHQRHQTATTDASGDAANLEKTATVQTITSVESIPAKKSFWQEMAVYNGTYTNEPLWKMVLSCFVILFNVAALYQILLTGIIIAWYVAVAVATSVIFAIPPRLLSSATIGYMSAAPLIGGFCASTVLTLLVEPTIKAMVRRNKGVYEPEFHLHLIYIGGVATVAGLVGWGYAIENFASIYVVCFCWGLMLFGMTWVATNATSWALDSYRPHSTEIFVMNMVFKNFFYYGLITFVIDWAFTQGPIKMGGTMAGVSGALLVLAIPMTIYGKRYRYFWHRHNLLEKLGLSSGIDGGMAH